MSEDGELISTLKKYATHPEFLGIDLVEVNQAGAVDNTPLHIAASKGELEDIRVLIEHGANINCVGDLGNTALHFAAMMGNEPAVKLLLKLGASNSILNDFQQSALDVAKLGGHDAVVIVLKKGNNSTQRPS